LSLLLLIWGMACPARAQEPLSLPSVDQTLTQLLKEAEFTADLSDSVIHSFRSSDLCLLIDALRINIQHRETSALYQRLTEPAATAACLDFYTARRDTLSVICQASGVDPALVIAIWYTESTLGEVTGTYRVRDLFFTLTLLDQPAVIDWNIAQALAAEPERDRADVESTVRRRSQRKRRWAVRELNMLLQLYPPGRLDTLAGSWAGATGIPQFLPTSIEGYGVDWDRDGVIDLTELGDAAASTANYLRRNGWRDNGSTDQQRRAVWSYNHSEPYVDGVLQLYHSIRSAAGEQEAP